MNYEEKELLLKDLCMRLPYGVKVEYKSIGCEVLSIDRFHEELTIWICPGYYPDVKLEDVKPYLFPLSSMTEEQFEELKDFADLKYEGNTLELVKWNDNCTTLDFWLEEIPSQYIIKVFDWLLKNHFDIYGLIPMGLANDATELNIY